MMAMKTSSTRHKIECTSSQARICPGLFLLLLLVLLGDFTASVSPADIEAKIEAGTTALPYQKPRRFLQAYDWMCRGGPGPACLEGVNVTCKVGGTRGCVCYLIHVCHPEVSGCYYHNGESVSFCGF